jgi:hypothetical protein
MDDDSSPQMLIDADDMATTREIRPSDDVSPDALCEIGVRSSATSSRPLWNIKAAWPSRAPMSTVSMRERHPHLFRLGIPLSASVAAFAITLVLACMFRASLEQLFARLLGH